MSRIMCIDLENGVDTNSGDSWTLDLARTDGVVSGTSYILSSATGGFGVPSLGPELITNGTFDVDCDGWTPLQASLVSEAGGYSGNYCKLTNVGPMSSPWGRMYQAVPTTPGAWYLFTAYLKTGGGSSIFYRFGTAVDLFDIASPATFAVTASWVMYTAAFQATTDTTYISIHNNNATSGNYIRIDEVSMKLDSSAMAQRYIYFPARAYSRVIIQVIDDNSVYVGSATMAAGTGLSFNIGGPIISTNALTAAIRMSGPGDDVRVAKSPDTTSCGVTSIWTQNSKTVTLSAKLTDHINTCSSLWTAGANVTITNNTSRKFGDYCQYIVGAAGAGIQILGYAPTVISDYSAYEQVSFWILPGTAIAAGALVIDLCSDANGAVPVNTIAVPACPVTGYYKGICVDTGAPLGNSIQSVAVRSLASFSSKNIRIDNIIACKAASSDDALSLVSLISQNSKSKSDFGDDLFYGIQSIDDSTILLDTSSLTYANAGQGYSGDSVIDVDLYKRETIKGYPSVVGTAVFTFDGADGQVDNPILFSGGWDSVTGLQDGETYLDCQGAGYVIAVALDYAQFSYFGCVRSYYAGINVGAYGFVGRHLKCGNSGMRGLFVVYDINNDIEIDVYNNGYGYTLYNLGSRNSRFVINSYGNTYSGTLQVFDKSSEIILRSKNNLYCLITYVDAYLKDSVIEDTGEATAANYTGAAVFSHNHDLGGLPKIFQQGGTITPVTDVRDVAEGYAWRFEPTSTSYVFESRPIWMDVGPIAVEANKEVTVTARMRRSDTGLTMRLFCKGGQLTGVASDVYSDMTAAADTWETVSIQFTPTETGAIDLVIHAFGGTTYQGWVHTIEWSQA